MPALMAGVEAARRDQPGRTGSNSRHCRASARPPATACSNSATPAKRARRMRSRRGARGAAAGAGAPLGTAARESDRALRGCGEDRGGDRAGGGSAPRRRLPALRRRRRDRPGGDRFADRVLLSSRTTTRRSAPPGGGEDRSPGRAATATAFAGKTVVFTGTLERMTGRRPRRRPNGSARRSQAQFLPRPISWWRGPAPARS